MRVTIKDVILAGVAPSTVTRVIPLLPSVKPQERVRSAMKELDYHQTSMLVA